MIKEAMIPRPTPFVMIGQNPYLGDFADAIHSVGGWLAKIVLNMPAAETPPVGSGKTFLQRVGEYQQWLDQNHAGLRCEVIRLEDFIPAADERYLMGFRGLSLKGVADKVQQQLGIQFQPLVHARAYVSPMAELAEGVFVGPQASIASFVKIGKHTLINRSVSVGHDTVIDGYCFVSPSAAIASSVHMKEQTLIGMGATVIEGLVLEEGSQLAAGTVLIRNTAPWTLYAGVPGKALKKREGPVIHVS